MAVHFLYLSCDLLRAVHPANRDRFQQHHEQQRHRSSIGVQQVNYIVTTKCHRRQGAHVDEDNQNEDEDLSVAPQQLRIFVTVW